MNKAVYEVQHHTDFFYQQPVRENTFVLMMCPLEGEYQKIRHYRLNLSPFAKISQYKDHYGNTKHFFFYLTSSSVFKDTVCFPGGDFESAFFSTFCRRNRMETFTVTWRIRINVGLAVPGILYKKLKSVGRLCIAGGNQKTKRPSDKF